MQAQPKQKKNWFLIIALILTAFLLVYLTTKPDNSKKITFTEFDKMVKEEGKIKKIDISGNDIYIMLNKDSSVTNEKLFPKQYDYTLEWPYTKTIDYLENEAAISKFEVNYRTPTQSFFEIIIPYVIFGAFSIILLIIIMKVMGKSNSNAMSFGKSRAKLIGETKVTFDNVAGCEEEKRELKEIVDFLRNPQKFISLGARIPKGFLLVGPPGTGKTLLARAVAGESNVPFYSITGSDFVEMFVGVGASRVRNLFEQAKRTSPCIIFIDEIDAVGRQRGTGLGGGNDEREQTLNQLLVEMDGFEPNSGIVVIAATNRSDVLDPALLRPGRFDRQVYVYPPDVRGREEILKVHSKNKPLDPKIDFKTLARLTTGFTGADIEMLLNEAAILAARENKLVITMHDLTEAINKVLLGPQKKSRVVTERDKKITAYHESGHAIIGKVLLKDSNIQEVSIIPRGGAGGYTLNRPENDDNYRTVNNLTNEIIMTMGGRAAEIIKLKDFTTGASSDIKQATNIARKMVTEWGMSPLGPISYGGGEEYFLGRDYQSKASYSENIAGEIDGEVSKIVNSCLEKAIKILKENDSILENMTELLLLQETIFTDEIDALMKGKTAKQIAKQIKTKETKKANISKKEQAELEKIKAERLKMQKERQAFEAAKFLESAGLIKFEVQQDEQEKTISNKKENKQNKEDKKSEETKSSNNSPEKNNTEKDEK